MRVAEWCVRIAALGAATGGLASCGAAAAPPGHSTRFPSTRLPTDLPQLVSTSPLPAPAVGRAVGTTQQVRAGGAALSVTVTQVIDPLLDTGASLLAGTRAIGVRVRIANAGPGVYDSSATGDFSIVPSSGPATPVFAASGICRTPLQDFDNYITPGESRSGCVAFAMSRAARLLAVRFSPHAEARGRLTWRIEP